ncbi:hypothetical protein GCM10010276_56160 [Streptomyces longisporus]|uniref:Uncharacterized protein n=1 Tax=Streptomyces longisporus TaxID=1948 RepID=A0ABN3MNA0_STRLO
MAGPLSQAVLRVGGEQITVTVVLARFAPAEREWGGVLLGVPVRVGSAAEHGQKVWLCFPHGQERLIHLAGLMPMDEGGHSMAFLGEGTVPSS